MAVSVSGPKTWFSNPNLLDMRAFDLERLANGQILVAFGGSSSTNAVLYTGLLDVGAGRLGALDTTTWATTSFAATVRKLDITAGAGNDALISLHSVWSTAGGADGNFSLVTLPTDGGTQRNVAPLPVNPGGAAEDTDDNFATVHLAGGGYAVFFTEPGTDGFADLSNGIRMARFNELGQRVGTTKTVIGERVVNTLANIENNPEQPAAVALTNGNIGLFYKENISDGSPRFLFQELTATGSKVGGAVTVAQGAVISPELTRLDNGTLLASWFDVASGTHRARVLDADGDLTGPGFALSSGGQQPQSGGDVVALGNGFAFSWLDTASGLIMGQLFSMTGQARSNPFLVTDNSGDFNSIGLTGGLERHGTGFLGYVVGVKPGNIGTVLEGQVFSAASSLGVTRTGTTAGETLNGGAKDDRLTLGSGNDRSDASGGNDLQFGGGGADTMAGGAGFDRMAGDAGNDVLNGDGGTDLIDGGTGNDRINGGSGSDRLTGGLGRDTVTGGGGADVFIFNDRSDLMTTITDFDAAQGDKLKILAAVYGFLGVFGPTNGTETNPNVSGLYFNTQTHILSQDGDGAGTFYPRINIAYLPGVDSLTLQDLLTF